MDAFLKDVKHSLRMFLQTPSFTFTAVAALTLGIGANTAIFSIVDAVLLKPVPFPEPDRLVMLMNTSPRGSGPAASPAKYQHWRSQTGVLENVAAFRNGVTNYTEGDVVEQFRSAQVSADYFRCFGTPILRGRTFSAEEDSPHGSNVTLLSYNLWTRRFGSDPAIVGKTISLSGDRYVVIGIIDQSFDVREFGPAPDVWVPFQLDPNTTDQGHYFQAAARLKRGVSLDQAKARLQVSAGEYRTKFPNSLQAQDGFSVTPFQEAFVSNVRSSLMVLLGAVGFVLLIACANVANLLLARATGRRREIAIRAAIGAGRGRIIRQLLTESVMLSLAGGVLGLLLGFAGIRALMSVNTAGLPRVGLNGSMIGVDWRVLSFTILVSVATGILFGLIPALQSSRADLNTVLKDSSGRSGTGFRHNKARSLLVIVEMGLAVILLVGSALLIRTSIALQSVNPGFETKNMLTMRMSLTGPRYLKSMGVEQTLRDGLDRIRALPGVLAASATCCVPLQGGYGLPFRIVGHPLQQGPFHGGGGWITASPGFFEVYKIPIKRGRSFNQRDDDKAPAVVIINETMAKQYWKGSDPLQDRLIIGRGVMREFKDEPERQIIGVVGDVRDGGLNRDPGPTMYIPQAQVPDAANALNVRISTMAWVIRTQGDPHPLLPAIQEQLRQSTGLPVSDIRSMDDVVSLSTGRQRFNMLLMSVFGCSALLLAAIGIYGLMTYSVQQRTQEIGIRLALGATTSQVKNMVVSQGMTLALAGAIIGLASAFGLTRFLESFLFSVKGHDPAVFIAVPLLLSLIALVAVWLPARRASRIEPTEALRYE
ncbi:MAG TPA: ABC transporter permease [Bryobacteraceae bacterium]|nr:ABC transporter permease [Bryobacteraceae bacterium]